MPEATIPLRCRCGAVRGELLQLSAATSNRAVCYCADCRAFAHHLDRPDVLDAHGGTDILQLPPSNVRLEAGSHLRLLRLSPGGLYRFFASCCRTPLGNVAAPWMPIVGIPVAGLLDEGLAARGLRLDELTQSVGGINGAEAVGGAPPGAHAKVPLKMMLELTPRWFGNLVRGRAQPSPYFDPSGSSRATEIVLTRPERDRLRAVDQTV
jgi:hypothetical protein